MHCVFENVTASSGCTTLIHAVPDKHVLNVLFLVIVIVDVLELTGELVHIILITSLVVWWLPLTA